MAEETTTQTTQQFRDVLQQTDHDAIVELRVLIQTLLTEVRTMKDDIKSNQATQAQALSAYQAKSDEVNKILDQRIRKLEDALTAGTPWGADITERLRNIETSITTLTGNRSQLIGGWKAITALGIVVAWLIGQSIAIYNIFTRLPMR